MRKLLFLTALIALSGSPSFAIKDLDGGTGSGGSADSALWADSSGIADSALVAKALRSGYVVDSALYADTAGVAVITIAYDTLADSALWADTADHARTADSAVGLIGGGGADYDSINQLISDSLANVSADSALFADSAGVAKKLTAQTRVYADTFGSANDSTYIVAGKAIVLLKPVVEKNDTLVKGDMLVDGSVIKKISFCPLLLPLATPRRVTGVKR